MPNLFIMRGIPGSGKSTYALKLTEDDAYILSYDGLRVMFAGQEDYSRIYTGYLNKTVAKSLEFIAINLFNDDQNVIIDNTSINVRDVSYWLNLCPAHYTVTIITVTAPLKVCIERAQQRTKKVPQEVIERMHEAFEFIDIAQYKNEKFPSINFLYHYT